jgi:maleate isomerase
VYTRVPRIGVAVLANDLAAEPELRLLLPDDMAFYVARVDYPSQVTPANLRIAERNLEAAVRSLAAVRPNVVVWACTSGSFYDGVEGNERLLEKLRTWAPQAEPLTAATAVVLTLKSMDARSVAVGSPYSPEINTRLRDFLECHGFRVAVLEPLFAEPVDDWTLQDLEPERVQEFARFLDRPGVDAIFISCTGVPAVAVAPSIEQELGKPLLTSNIAIARAALAACRRQPAEVA